MTVLEAILEEMDRLGLDNATGINICELIDRHNIEVHEEVVGLVNSWREHNKNEKKDL
jgi:hypothetical protein